MKVKWVNPDIDEVLTFDVPDGAVCLQFGALCVCGNDRRIVSIDVAEKRFTCSPRHPTAKGYTRLEENQHTSWSRIHYTLDRRGDTMVATVYEGEAPPVTVHADLEMR